MKLVIDENCVDDRQWSANDKFQSKDTGDILKSSRIFGVEIEACHPREADRYIICNNFPDLGHGSDGGGVEFKTPRISGKIGEQYIIDLCDALEQLKFKVSSSCGLHIHLDGGDKFIEKNSSETLSQKTENLRKLFKYYLTFEDVIQSFIAPSRRRSCFCAPMRNRMSIAEINKTKDQFDLEKIWYGSENKVSINFNKTAYRGGPRLGINFSPFFGQNHIEVRYHSGTMNARKILEWVNLHAGIMDVASDGRFRTVDTSLMASLEEKTWALFDILKLSQDSIEYFLARQEMFKKKVELPTIDMRKMKAIILADNEVLV
jgi:hypothetical protein